MNRSIGGNNDRLQLDLSSGRERQLRVRKPQERGTDTDTERDASGSGTCTLWLTLLHSTETLTTQLHKIQHLFHRSCAWQESEGNSQEREEKLAASAPVMSLETEMGAAVTKPGLKMQGLLSELVIMCLGLKLISLPSSEPLYPKWRS